MRINTFGSCLVQIFLRGISFYEGVCVWRQIDGQVPDRGTVQVFGERLFVIHNRMTCVFSYIASLGADMAIQD